MGRSLRPNDDGLTYHALSRGNNRDAVLHDDGDFRAFPDALGRALLRYPFRLYGYCLMTNHFHLLLRPEPGVAIGRVMQSLLVAHTWRSHKRHRTLGHAWQGRFKSRSGASSRSRRGRVRLRGLDAPDLDDFDFFGTKCGLETSRRKECQGGARKSDRHPTSRPPMVASVARIAANRINCLKSTGPKTNSGKSRSRGNSTRHGLCSTVVVHPDDASRLAGGPGEAAAPVPGDEGFDAWLRGQVALATVKLERCQAMERAVRARVVLRAGATWDDDRRAEAVRLASKLAGRPEEVVTQLRATFHGCDWLAGRWAMLAHAADSNEGNWTPEQARLAFDLMGTPLEFREGGPPGTAIDPAGKLAEPAPAPAAVARRTIDELEKRIELLRPLEEDARDQAEADLSDDDELRRLRRYEAELFRRMKWALGQLPEEARPLEPASTPEAEPSAKSTPPRQPPSFTLPAQPSRAERRLMKAELRREAKRRKNERLND